jgi:DNA-binding response OmpR family regulator
MARILIVDDDEALATLMDKALRAEGYEVRRARDGPAGLKLLEEQPADLVLLDVRLPGMSGLEVLRQIREQHPRTLVLVITGYSSLPVALEAVEGGAVGYLTKPFKMADLRDRVNKTLGRSGGGGGIVVKVR